MLIFRQHPESSVSRNRKSEDFLCQAKPNSILSLPTKNLLLTTRHFYHCCNFIPANEELVEVSEELYREYYRPIWNTRYHARKNGECCCTKAQLWKCDGVCPGCPFYTAGKKVSLDTAIGGENDELTLGDTLRDDSQTIESIIIEKELLEALYEELDRLDPEGKRICELMMYHSERESAEIMGMARSTFKRHWAKIRDELRDKLKDYYF